MVVTAQLGKACAPTPVHQAVTLYQSLSQQAEALATEEQGAAQRQVSREPLALPLMIQLQGQQDWFLILERASIWFWMFCTLPTSYLNKAADQCVLYFAQCRAAKTLPARAVQSRLHKLSRSTTQTLPQVS